MSKFFKRGIHNKKFLYEIENGSLKPLVELVNSLCLLSGEGV